MGIKLGSLYKLMISDKKHDIVIPFNGEKIEQVGISHGFVHYVNLSSGNHKGFCGVAYFEDNATLLV